MERSKGIEMGYSLPEFMAQAMALELEAAERYLELADMMEAHNNLETAQVFRDMSRFSALHHDEIAKRAAGLTLPKLSSWEFRWTNPPEVGDVQDVHYLMTAYHALCYARDNEVRGMEYYRAAAQKSDDQEVRRLGNEFANEESEHVVKLDKWIEVTPRPSLSWEEDPDPARAVD